MAIFGKKKSDKDKQQTTTSNGDSISSITPVVDGSQKSQQSPYNARDASGIPTPGGGSHIPKKGSLSGPGAAGVGTTFASNANPAGNYPPSGIPGPGQGAGAASGFRFGGPASRPDGTTSGIPVPGQGSTRGRKPSEQGTPTSSIPAGLGPGASPGTGLPPSSGPDAGLPPSSGLQNIPNDKARSQQVVYPWSQRSLVMNPPRFLDETRQAPPGALSPFPFPRYGHAVNQTASPTGELYLFGGLVRESVKNDLYTLHVDKLISQTPTSPPNAAQNSIYASATLVQTTGEIPPPRVGHATVLVSNVLILWGGDTKIRADDKQDEGLYLLNLSIREWTRVKAGDGPGSCPVGRYGHSVAIIGSRFFVFGGQVDGNFMNDLWSFDLNSLKSTPTWEEMKPTGDAPPKRTGHASVTCKDKIYIFGGTDGQYHYNDTWCYDLGTNTWSELSCIGYIPVPREGHAACLVDDVMYIFGGRGVDGKDLGDLASFKISNQRWFMFANMGPSPSGRSGHAMSTFQNKVVVLGGESFTGAKPDDPGSIHVLDSLKIKYPADTQSQAKSPGPSNLRNVSAPATNAPPAGAGPGAPGSVRSVAPPQDDSDQKPPMSPTRAVPEQLAASSPLRGQDQYLASQQQQGFQQHPYNPSQNQPGAPYPSVLAPAGSQFGQQGGSGFNNEAAGRTGFPPAQLSQDPMSRGPLGPMQPPQQPSGPGASTYGGPRSQRSFENTRAMGTLSPVNVSSMRNLNGAVGKLDSPANAPQDGFHYGRTMSPPATNGYNMPSFAPSEVDAMRKREAWYKAALAMAVKKGFVEPENLQTDMTDAQSVSSGRLSLDGIDTGAEGSDKDRVIRTLISLKAALAGAKATIAQQAQGEADRLSESDRARSAALQEAAYYRAKLSAIESGNANEVSRLDRERAAKLEKSLADALRESTQLERQTNSLREQTKLEQQLRTSAEERLSETAKRAMAAEAAQMKAYDELASLQKRNYASESALREHTEQVATLSSMASRHKADHDNVSNQLEEAHSNVAAHLAALTQLQAAHSSVASRATEYERIHKDQRSMLQQHQSTISDLRAQLESKSNEAYTHSSRAAELEILLSQHREEADAHRNAATGGLAALLAHKEQTASRDLAAPSVPAHVEEKMRALEEEAESLRMLHAEARQTADAHANSLQEVQTRQLSTERQHAGLRSEMTALRSQLTIALQEAARLKDLSSAKDLELRERNRAIETSQVKTNLMKQFMAERGVTVPSDDEFNVKPVSSDSRVRELEEELDARARDLQEAEHNLQDSESRVEELTRELEHHASLNANRSLSDTSGLGSGEAERRAQVAERELADTTAAYKDRMAQLENDYQTAVQFVKGTEKMLRRMKDELTKYKNENATLQTELGNLRSAHPTEESGRSAEAARDIEALRSRLADVTQQSEVVMAENRELERKVAQLAAGQRDSSERSRDTDMSHAASPRRVTELEGEIARLESSLNASRREVQKSMETNKTLSEQLATRGGPDGVAGGDAIHKNLSAAQSSNEQLKHENAVLTQRLQELDDKFQLLLGRMETNHESDGRPRESVNYGSITSELDKWEQGEGLAPTHAAAPSDEAYPAHA